MNELITDFVQTLINEGYFDHLPQNDRLFYKNSKLRKDNEWYERCRVASELLKVEKQLDKLVDRYCEDKVLHELLANKKKICVSSIPNTKFSLVDYFFCKYLEKQYPHLSVELIKMIPVDEYHFFDFDRERLDYGGDYGGDYGSNTGSYRCGVSHQNHPRPKKYIINISESERGPGHVFVCDESGCWR